MEVPNHLSVNWLKRSYSETSVGRPDAKRVKFSDIQAGLMAQFQSDRISTTACSTALQEAFPHSQRKHIGKAKHMYVIGIELSVQQESRDPVQILRTENEQLSIKANQLERKRGPENLKQGSKN